MVINSAKKSNTSENHRNGNNESRIIAIPQHDLYVEVRAKNNDNYKKGGLVFPSYDLYKVLKNINKNLNLLYTETGEERDYEPIFDSDNRWDSDRFDCICKNINTDISVFKDLSKNDSRVGEFLHNNRLSEKFSLLFSSIYYAFMEAMCEENKLHREIINMQLRKIKKIVRELSYNGIDPFAPQMI